MILPKLKTITNLEITNYYMSLRDHLCNDELKPILKTRGEVPPVSNMLLHTL